MNAYKYFIRPVLFQIDAEKVHNFALRIGSFLGRSYVLRKSLAFFYGYNNDRLYVNIKGIRFRNPVGLAAGFDKNGVITNILPSIGFGFEEIGSVTAKKCEGNKKPRLFRLVKDKAIVVNYGLCNDGAEAVFNRLKSKSFEIPIGISIAKTNDSTIKGSGSIEDYCAAFKVIQSLGNFIVINISCPNSGDGKSFEDPVLLEKLLKKLKPKKPMFLKLSADITQKKLDKIIGLGKKYQITGFVVANLIHDRIKLKTSKERLSKMKGAVSGPLMKEKSNKLIKYIYKKTKGKFVIIGVGGIFNAEEAYERIRNGANLVQLLTGMIYEGPGLVKKINKGLVKLLKKDGFNNIQEAVGADAIGDL